MTSTAPTPITIPGWTSPATPLREGLDQELLLRAYKYSERAHAGQTRSSGEPYVSHCVEVAHILADLHLDSVTVADMCKQAEAMGIARQPPPAYVYAI